MSKPLGVIEPINRRSRKTWFSFLGVPVSYTPFAALSLPFNTLEAFPYAFLRHRGASRQELAKGAIKYGSAMFLTNVIHSIGHILSGKAVGAPMDELILTSTRHVNHYSGPQEQYPKSTHIGRALGGPLLNLAVALALFLIIRKRENVPDWFVHIARFNAFWGLGSFAPIPSVDGASIWEHLRK